MKRLLSACTLAAATVLLAGCGGGDDPFLPETVKLRVGQPKTADAGSLTLAMTKVIDSRCPSTVVCVSPGSAVIDVSLSQQGRSPATVQMTLVPGTAAQVYNYGPYRIEFTELTPYPSSPVLTITDSEATLVVRR